MLDRRNFCLALALFPLGALLADCDRPREAVPALDPAAGPAVAGKDKPQLVATLLAADWAADTPAGLTAGYSIREIDPDGATAVTIAFVVSYNSSHRVSYAVFDEAGDAGRAYATAAAALRADSRGAALTYPDGPYPATTIFYADLGRGVLLVGPIVVHILATGTNRQFFDALVSASVSHLARSPAYRSRPGLPRRCARRRLVRRARCRTGRRAVGDHDGESDAHRRHASRRPSSHRDNRCGPARRAAVAEEERRTGQAAAGHPGCLRHTLSARVAPG